MFCAGTGHSVQCIRRKFLTNVGDCAAEIWHHYFSAAVRSLTSAAQKATVLSFLEKVDLWYVAFCLL